MFYAVGMKLEAEVMRIGKHGVPGERLKNFSWIWDEVNLQQAHRKYDDRDGFHRLGILTKEV